MTKAKLCYICTPYRGNLFQRVRNVLYARKVTRSAIKSGYIPITPHLYITQVLNDKDPDERIKGIEIAMELLDMCEVILIGNKYGISRGMAAEIAKASVQNMTILRTEF